MEIWKTFLLQIGNRIANQKHFNSESDLSHETMKKKRMLKIVQLKGESENEIEINARINCQLLGTDGTKSVSITTGKEYIA